VTIALQREHRDGRAARAERIRKETRTSIVRAAREIFEERGYHAASVDDVIDRAGIARATFYLHFQSKRELFSELLDALLGDLKACLVRVDLASHVAPFDQLVGNVERVLRELSEHKELAHLVLHGEADGDRDFEHRIARFHAHAHMLMRDSLAAGQRLGLVRVIDVDFAASAALGAFKEIFGRHLIHGDRDNVARALLDVVLGGLLTPPSR
jgi:AcrR family transcriptional regulator